MKIKNFLPKIREDVSLAGYTTFKIGGPARYFYIVRTTRNLINAVKAAKKCKLPFFVLGGGSNILVADRGYNGLIIKLQTTNYPEAEQVRYGAGKLQTTKIIKVGAGVKLADFVKLSLDKGLAGLEWAAGIPGTVGGAIRGNAGAFGKSISENLEEVSVFDIADSKIKIFKNNDCKFSYRNSIFKHNQNLIILSAILRLKKGEKEKMQNLLKDYAKQRIESNPIGYSAGCFFKNIEWRELRDREELIKKFPELKQFRDEPKISVGFLIDQVGLKGKKIGGAEVSEKHAAFIINSGKAAADDVINLSNLIKQKVSERYGLTLKEEVVIV